MTDMAAILMKDHTRRARREAVLWAQDALANPDALILDVETTGLDEHAEPVQIGILTMTGRVLLDTMIRPATGAIPKEASLIHGITDGDLIQAVTFADLYPLIVNLLRDRCLIAYNADFDRRILRQTRRKYNLLANPGVKNWACAMIAYAKFWGDWNHFHGNWRWQSLRSACLQQRIPVHDAHSAIGDCRLTLALLMTMAATITEFPGKGEANEARRQPITGTVGRPHRDDPGGP